MDAAPEMSVTISMTPDGMITVSAAGSEPQPAESLDQALQAAGVILQEMAGASQAPEGQMDQQAIWDEMAAERPQRGNTM